MNERAPWWRKRKMRCSHCDGWRAYIPKRTLSAVLVCSRCDQSWQNDVHAVWFPQEWILEQLNAIRIEKTQALIDGPPGYWPINCRCSLLPFRHAPDQHNS